MIHTLAPYLIMDITCACIPELNRPSCCLLNPIHCWMDGTRSLRSAEYKFRKISLQIICRFQSRHPQRRNGIIEHKIILKDNTYIPPASTVLAEHVGTMMIIFWFHRTGSRATSRRFKWHIIVLKRLINE